MEDEQEQLAKWRAVCPALFDECTAEGISEYVVLNALQRIEHGDIASVEQAREQILRQHAQKLAIRQRMLAQAQAQSEQPETAGFESGESSPEAITQQDVAADDEAGALPAWVGVRSHLHERALLIWHAMCTEYIKIPQACRPTPVLKGDDLDLAVKQTGKELLLALEDAIVEAVRGHEGAPSNVLRPLIEPVISTRKETVTEGLVDAVLSGLGFRRNLSKGRAATANKAGAERRQAEAAEELRGTLMAAIHTQLGELCEVLAGSVQLSIPLVAPPSPALDPPFMKELLSGFECAICSSLPKNPCTTQCGHSFCLDCFEDACTTGKRTCPICRESVGAITRYVQPNGVQRELTSLLARGAKRKGSVTLEELRKAVSCPACKFVMSGVVSAPTGHSFCGVCFSLLAHGEGERLSPHVPDERAFRALLGIRSKLRVNVAINNAVGALFPAELARYPPVVRKRSLVGEPLDGRKYARISRPRLPGAQALTPEEREAERRKREAERIANLIAQGKDIFQGERDNSGMPDISHILDNRGRPLKHNRSCHVCTQGNASWRGGFFQPLGCSKCPMIFCPRCLGNILQKPYGIEEGKAFVDQYICERQFSYVCVCCENRCACQKKEYEAVEVISTSADKQTVVSLKKPHAFDPGDKIRFSGHSGTADDETLKKHEWPVIKIISPTSFTIDLDLRKGGGKGGKVELIRLQKHKKVGWAGATGFGLQKDAPIGKKYVRALVNGTDAKSAKAAPATCASTKTTKSATTKAAQAKIASVAVKRSAPSAPILPAKKHAKTPPHSIRVASKAGSPSRPSKPAQAPAGSPTPSASQSEESSQGAGMSRDERRASRDVARASFLARERAS